MAYTFDKKNADAPSTHKTQYFEMFGDRAHLPRRLDGQHQGDAPAVGARPRPRRACSTTVGTLQPERGLDAVQDVAAKNPAKLKELQELFWKEAEKYQVLPLDTTVSARLITPRPSITAGRNVFTWTRPLTGTPNGDAPSVLNASYNFKAEVEIPKAAPTAC